MIRWPLRIEGCSRVGCIFKLSLVQLEEDKWPLTGLRFTVSSPFSGHSLYPLYQKQAQLTVPCGGSPTPPSVVWEGRKVVISQLPAWAWALFSRTLWIPLHGNRAHWVLEQFMVTLLILKFEKHLMLRLWYVFTFALFSLFPTERKNSKEISQKGGTWTALK